MVGVIAQCYRGQAQANIVFLALWIATILIFIRSVYRIVELQGGFNGSIANNETVFMIFEGPMIILATLAVTVIHPGFAFGGDWKAATWSLRGRKANPSADVAEMTTTKWGV
jgi:hypothetical protein